MAGSDVHNERTIFVMSKEIGHDSKAPAKTGIYKVKPHIYKRKK